MKEDGETSIRDDGAPTVVLPSSRPQSVEPDKQSGAEPSAVVEPPAKEDEDRKIDQQDEGIYLNCFVTNELFRTFAFLQNRPNDRNYIHVQQMKL